jgi:VCBS repeat-containing protein
LPGWDAPVITQAVKGFFFVVRVTPPCVANSVTVSAFYAGFTDTRPMLRVPGSTNQWEATFPTSAAGSVLPYRIEADCTPRAFSGFFVFVDPSGAILDGCTGQPLSGATVTLLKNEPYGSSTYVVPEPTEHIPSFNPEVTAADGLYGWDVVPGRWRVRASKPGYDTVTTDPFDVPPPKLNLDITLTPIAGCNVPPVAHDDAYAADQGTPLNVAAPGVLGNDTDANGNPLTASIVANATNGNVTLNSDGSFTYTPNTGFHGTDTFTYKASDGTQDSNLATATIAVGQVNQPPSAVNDAYSTRKNRTLIVGRPGVLANDSDPEGAALTAVLVRRPTRGILLLSPHGSFVYLPRPGFVGRDTFTYKASDGARSSGVTTVTIDVTRKRHRGHGDHDDDDDCDEDDARRLER